MSTPPDVVFKVIKRKTRYSALINGNTKYGIKYIKDQEVYGISGTLGIFCFTDEAVAIHWANVICNDHEHNYFYSGHLSPKAQKRFKIIKATPLGPLKKSLTVAMVTGTPEDTTARLDHYYKNHCHPYAGCVLAPYKAATCLGIKPLE